MLDRTSADRGIGYEVSSSGADGVGGSRLFWATKRAFDIGMSLLLLLIFFPVALILLVFNPFFNRGSLFYLQKRMGRNCQPFYAIKFRSMSHTKTITRGHEDPIEHHRITRLGRLIRRMRVDELPQILNVLKGEMSLIGPRPDYYEHACVFLSTVPGYAERHAVRPGISGLAQVDLGYAEGSGATRNKVLADLDYIRNAGFRQELRLFFKTISTVVLLAGA